MNFWFRISILFLILFILGCSKSGLKFSLKNDTDFTLKDIKVRLHDTTLFFSKLEPHSQTTWTDIYSSYTYGYMKFTDNNDSTYIQQPVDFVGETLCYKGELTFIIREIDTKTKHIKTTYSLKKK